MTDRYAPGNAAELAEAVRDARGLGRALEVVAGGSRYGYGRPVEADAVLDVSGIAGIVDYDPAELVLTARPGTPMREVAALLVTRGQHLAFEVCNWAPLWGGEAGAGTLGGALAMGLGGPRRPLAGGPRDHLLGFEAVNGLGEIFSGGGKVIKNVTGYDMPKLMAGAMGTLAVLSEVTVKVLPAPPDCVCLHIEGLGDADAIRAMAAALGSQASVSGAAHLPLGHTSLSDKPLTLLRLEGVPVSVEERARMLGDLIGRASGLVRGDAARALWRDVGDVRPLAVAGDEIIWRITLPPSRGAAFVAALPDGLGARRLFDWGGGLVWLFLPPAGDGHAAAVREALAGVAGGEGQATLFRAPEAVRRAHSPFQPLEPGLRALNQRVKERFDPDHVLNPGRLYGSM